MYLVVPLKSIVLLLAWNQGFVDELTFCILFVSHHYLWATKITLIIYLDRVIDRTTMQARRRFKAPQILMVIMTSILATCTISRVMTVSKPRWSRDSEIWRREATSTFTPGKVSQSAIAILIYSPYFLRKRFRCTRICHVNFGFGKALAQGNFYLHLSLISIGSL